jgi:deoxyribonuclease-4
MPLPTFTPPARFGAHMPTAGGLHNAMHAGLKAGCDVVQIFTKSPQQWKAKELTDDQVMEFYRAQVETGIPCIAAHDTYLINPCSADEEIARKSREALADELVRSSRLAIPYVVMHCGSPGECPEPEGLGRLVDTLKYMLDHAPDDGSVPLLETMAGQGKCVGHSFEHLAHVIDALGAGDRLGICLDTCHIFAAGYDIRDEECYRQVIDQLDRTVGLHRLKLIHANDSKKELGSRVDRHEHIGKGHIGPDGFRFLLTDERLAHVPVVLETPKEGEMDPVNLAALREAAGIAAEHPDSR